MLTLGIETSGRAGTVALCLDEKCLEERALDQTGRRHARSLVAEIDALFHSTDFELREIQHVAVSIGPGSFTGLRVGVACAKTLAYATGCQLAAVDTFQAIAENSPDEINQLAVISNAQRGELFLGNFHRQADGHFLRQGEIEIVNKQSWCEERTGDDVVGGTGVELIRELLEGKCRLLEPATCEPQAGVIARLGRRQIEQGRADDLWSLEPFYFRKSAAEEKWDREHPQA